MPSRPLASVVLFTSAAVLSACPTSTATSDTPSDPTTWDGLSPMTLDLDGEVTEVPVFAAGGYEYAQPDEPPLIVVVPASNEPDRTTGGFSLLNLGLTFESAPLDVADAWLAGEDRTDDPVQMVLSISSDDAARFTPETPGACTATTTHLEPLPENPLLPQITHHRYDVRIDCTDVPWEDVLLDGPTGTWSSVTIRFDAGFSLFE
ncbi:MAG: hypothetical protein KTR31_21325 [Myxococcales bacterium]|nr:hypothetical protein [Myxococcales bacterium]